MSAWTAQAQVSADRTIEKNTLTAGSETNVTVIIKNNNTQPLAVLKESIPSGWTLTRISDDADGFKSDADEWAWSPRPGNNTDKNVKYRLNIPDNVASGTYMIDGNVITVLNTTTKVSGDAVITVTGGSSDGSSNSGGSGSGNGTYPTATTTPEKNETNAAGSPTETITAQPPATESEQETSTPEETVNETPEATATQTAPGFGVIFSSGIMAAIYVLRRKK